MSENEHDHSQNSGQPEVITGTTTVEGEPNGLPPAAPGVQLAPPAEVKHLREWFHQHVKNSVHSQDTLHYNELHRLTEAMCAKLHSKYPLAKEDANPITKET